MQRLSFCRWCVLLITCAALACTLNAQTTERPISDFLAAQGQTSQFFPPVADLLGWAQGMCASGGLNCMSKPPYDGLCLADFAWVDYAGVAERFLVQNGAMPSGTYYEGFVQQRPLDNGRVEVTVSLHTRNALVWVSKQTKLIPGTACAAPVDYDWYGPLALGARPTTLPPIGQRALGDAFLHLTFQNPAGAPLPDVIDLFYNRFSDIDEYSFHAVASGPVPGGGNGAVTIQQAGKGLRGNLQPSVVNFRETGK